MNGSNPIQIKPLKSLPSEGKKILVICPGFASDCVETLEEISIEGKETFLQSGGKNFRQFHALTMMMPTLTY